MIKVKKLKLTKEQLEKAREIALENFKKIKPWIDNGLQK